MPVLQSMQMINQDFFRERIDQTLNEEQEGGIIDGRIYMKLMTLMFTIDCHDAETIWEMASALILQARTASSG